MLGQQRLLAPIHPEMRAVRRLTDDGGQVQVRPERAPRGNSGLKMREFCTECARIARAVHCIVGSRQRENSREAVAKLNEKPVLALTMRVNWEGFSAASCYWATKTVLRPQVHFDLRL